MRKNFYIALLVICTFVINAVAFAKCNQPKIFLYFESFPKNKQATQTNALKKYQYILTNSKIAGAQIRYSWRELEPKKGVYNFARIQNDLDYLTSIHKKLVIQLQYNSFYPKTINVPLYIVQDSLYRGGVVEQIDSAGGVKKNVSEGWVARIWDPAVAVRLHLLFKALASKFDGRVYAINLPETAIDITTGKHASFDFTPEKYFNAVINNMKALKQSFSKSLVIQYVNFFPGEWLPWTNKHFMDRIFAYAEKHNIGLGGPDVAPYRKGQMQNSYKYFHKYKGKLVAVAMAVQSGDYSYKNPKTKQKYTTEDFVSFAVNYLGADHLFWTVQEPFFSKKFVPDIKKNFCSSMLKQR